MNPAIKYTLGRLGLFLAVFALLWPVELNILLKLMIAVLFSAGLAYFLLRGWRDEMANQLSSAASRRKADRDRLRSALAGEDQVDPTRGAVPGTPATTSDRDDDSDSTGSGDGPETADRDGGRAAAERIDGPGTADHGAGPVDEKVDGTGDRSPGQSARP